MMPWAMALPRGGGPAPLRVKCELKTIWRAYEGFLEEWEILNASFLTQKVHHTCVVYPQNTALVAVVNCIWYSLTFIFASPSHRIPSFRSEFLRLFSLHRHSRRQLQFIYTVAPPQEIALSTAFSAERHILRNENAHAPFLNKFWSLTSKLRNATGMLQIKVAAFHLCSCWVLSNFVVH